MQNFDYSIPTKVYFGKGQVEKLSLLSQFGSRVLLCYGGGSIKKMGLYDTVLQILKQNQMSVFELSGIDPNPRIESVRQAPRACNASLA